MKVLTRNLTMPALTQPITLLYHGVISAGSQIPDHREPGADLYDVPLNSFRTQMEYLYQNNFNVSAFSLEPKKQKITITFDDGELNNFTQALPVLREFQFPAYFFVTVNRIGKNGYMRWDHLRQLSQWGIRV